MTAREAILAVLERRGELERGQLYSAVSTLYKRELRRRNSPQARHFQAALDALAAEGQIEDRYVPFWLSPDEPRLGRHYYSVRDGR